MVLPRGVIAVLLALGAGSAVASTGAADRVRTLVQAHGPITAVAQDGGRIAWESDEPSNDRCPFLVRIRTLATKKQTAVVTAAKGSAGTCGNGFGTGFDGEPRLALAGDRAVWLQHDSGNSQYFRVVYGSLADPVDRTAGAEIVLDNVLSFDVPQVAGDGKNPIFAYAVTGQEDTEQCNEQQNCRHLVYGGGVFRVVGPRLVKIPQAPTAALAALSGSTVALLSRGRVGQVATPGPPRTIEIRRAADGRLLGQFDAAAKVKAIAVSQAFVAVLTANGLEVHTTSGALRRRVAVPAGAASELSASPAGAVYRVGPRIFLVRFVSGAPRLLAVARTTPVSLSIEGKRVVWVENALRGKVIRGRIQAIDAP